MRPDGSDLMNRTNHPASTPPPTGSRSTTTTTRRTTETTTEPPTSVSEGPSPCGPAHPSLLRGLRCCSCGRTSSTRRSLCGRSRSSGSGRQPVFLHDSSVARTDISGPATTEIPAKRGVRRFGATRSRLGTHQSRINLQRRLEPKAAAVHRDSEGKHRLLERLTDAAVLLDRSLRVAHAREPLTSPPHAPRRVSGSDVDGRRTQCQLSWRPRDKG
jgi:hypothetical protein